MIDNDIRKEFELLNKQFGEGSIMLGDIYPKDKLDVISTNSIGLDFKTGIGGIPKGKITEIFGIESSSKSTMCAHICANAQSAGGLAYYADGEHCIDSGYFTDIGVDMNNLAISQPDNMETALNILEKVIQLNKFSVIIFDSIAALSTKAELSGGVEDVQMGDKARLLGRHFRRIVPIIKKSNTAVVYVNQTRSSIGGYGYSVETPGGKALKFAADMRIELKIAASQVKVGTEPIGSKIRARIVKNKLSKPFGEWEFLSIWGKGIAREADLLEIAEQHKIIERKGSWYVYNEDNIGQGLYNAISYLENNKSVYKEIEDKVRQLLGMSNV